MTRRDSVVCVSGETNLTGKRAVMCTGLSRFCRDAIVLLAVAICVVRRTIQSSVCYTPRVSRNFGAKPAFRSTISSRKNGQSTVTFARETRLLRSQPAVLSA